MDPDVLSEKPSLLGVSRKNLALKLSALGMEDKFLRMRTAQLWHWIYVRGVTSFSDMANVSKTLRETLSAHYTLARPEISNKALSVDGTIKWLLRMPPDAVNRKGVEIECVYIPDRDRGTLCVSSQVGCTLNCAFCHTGTQKLVRNLSDAEIVQQAIIARDALADYPGQTEKRRVTNIVFMGMGEPLYNPDNVLSAIETLADPDGLQFSRRRITVSTSGVVPEISRLGKEARTMLAISLHAVTDALRNELVPLNRKYPIAELLEACRNYPGLSNARRITFEYVMLKDVNDDPEDARRLVRLLQKIPSKINLIPFNIWPGTTYERSTPEKIETFMRIVMRAGYASPVRTPRGQDVQAACGQLKTQTEKIRASARKNDLSSSAL